MLYPLFFKLILIWGGNIVYENKD